VEEGLLPHYRRGEEIEDLEEERRLCYVGITRAKEKVFLSRAERRSTFGVGRANLPSRFLDELPHELLQIEEGRARDESSDSEKGDWSGLFEVRDELMDSETQERTMQASEERVLSPEGFMPLRIGMRVRHPKFGVGRVRSVEGMDEEQKATIVFQTAGPKRIKVCYVQMEILE
jgi:DNA helicase-2/ATP-dependent DNA helicase PcrA